MTINLPSLYFESLPDRIIFGQAVNLLVNTNGLSSVMYTASFSCSTGSYQVSGLTTGMTYQLVPAGIYGNAVITVTAPNTQPGTAFINIEKYGANIPPAFIPAQMAYSPSVYSNGEEDLEIFSSQSVA